MQRLFKHSYFLSNKIIVNVKGKRNNLNIYEIVLFIMTSCKILELVMFFASTCFGHL